MRAAPFRSQPVVMPRRSAPLALILSLGTSMTAFSSAASARTHVDRPGLTPLARQQQAEIAEQALLDAREARLIGQPDRACALDRLVVQGLAQAHGPGSVADWTIELISAERNVSICQESDR